MRHPLNSTINTLTVCFTCKKKKGTNLTVILAFPVSQLLIMKGIKYGGVPQWGLLRLSL